MYEVLLDEEVINYLEELPRELKERIFKKIVSAKENPFHFFERLTEIDGYKLRVGDYRIIADINQTERKIEVRKIGHRKNIYQKP